VEFYVHYNSKEFKEENLLSKQQFDHKFYSKLKTFLADIKKTYFSNFNASI
jgi:hypothetical protein